MDVIRIIAIITGFYLRGLESKTLFMSKNGSTSNSCLTSNNACDNITRVIELSQTGDAIQIAATGTEDSPLEICSDLPILHDLAIEGTMGTPTIQCTKENLAVFEIFYGTVNIKNLRITEGLIRTSNAGLVVEECVFVEDARIYGMSNSSAVKHAYYPVFYSAKHMIESLINSSKGYLEDHEVCHFTNITIKNSQWISQRPHGHVYFDIFREEGFQVICEKVNIIVENVEFAEKTVYVMAVTDLHVNFYDTEFKGREQGVNYMGGLLIETFPLLSDIDVTIENCTFKNLKFDQILFEIAFQYDDLWTVALNFRSLHNKSFYLKADKVFGELHNIVKNNSQNKEHLNWKGNVNVSSFFKGSDGKAYNDYGYNIKIINSTFEKNSRAISFVYDTDMVHRPSAQITNCKFRNNSVVFGGGAISASGLIYLNIDSCDFTNNSAGADIQPEQKFKNVNYRLAKHYYLVILEYHVSRDSFKVKYEELDKDFESGKEIGVGTIELTGEGGAIFLRDIYCEVHHSVFKNNFAYKYGGSIFGSATSNVGVYNSIFNKSEGIESIDGRILRTFGTMMLKNDIFRVAQQSRSHSTIINHFTDANKERVWVSNVTLKCPENTQLLAFNASGDMFSDEGEREDVLGFKKLAYLCALCAWGNYSLRSGFIEVPDVNNLTSKKGDEVVLDPDLLVREIKLSHVTCNLCPYGGTCKGPVISKPNFWGAPSSDLSSLNFHRCPTAYCCSSTKCKSYNQCATNRYGRLCSRCLPGYTEALFSAKCVQESECRDYWALVMVILLAFGYSAFLLFQKDFKEFLLGAPLGRRALKRVFKQVSVNKEEKNNKVDEKLDNRKDELNWNAPETEEEKDEGGVFLILLFYYFQDAAIVHINTIYVDPETALVNSIKQVVGGIFKFRLDVLHFATAICTFPGLTPAIKIVFKLFFVPLVLIILISIYLASLCLEKSKTGIQIWDFLARRSALAIMFAILFSYQKLATSLFQLVNCVTINDQSVMFVDAEIECYTFGQSVVFLLLAFSICPFSFYIALSPALMKKGYISLGEFFLGCLLPLPMAIYWTIKYVVKKNTRVFPTDDAVSVYKLLQGPYREFNLPGILRYTCWSGVLLGRRLCLILAATFISNVVIRLSIMMAVCQIALVHHVLVRPCKERRGNAAGTISSSALLIVCTVNFLRAAYESAEYVPDEPNFTLMKVFDQVENSLLLWIPMAGVIIILLVLISRLIVRFFKHIKSPNSSVISPNDSTKVQVTENKGLKTRFSYSSR